MSWNFKKVGNNKEALKASVQAEFAPQAVKDEVCTRIDGVRVEDGKEVIYAASHGHLNDDPARPYSGLDEMVIRVQGIPFITAPTS